MNNIRIQREEMNEQPMFSSESQIPADITNLPNYQTIKLRGLYIYITIMWIKSHVTLGYRINMSMNMHDEKQYKVLPACSVCNQTWMQVNLTICVSWNNTTFNYSLLWNGVNLFNSCVHFNRSKVIFPLFIMFLIFKHLRIL